MEEQKHLANYFILRWDEEALDFKYVEHWGIKIAEVNARLEVLAVKYGRKNLCIVANLNVVPRADIRALIKKVKKRVANDCRLSK